MIVGCTSCATYMIESPSDIETDGQLVCGNDDPAKRLAQLFQDSAQTPNGLGYQPDVVYSCACNQVPGACM